MGNLDGATSSSKREAADGPRHTARGCCMKRSLARSRASRRSPPRLRRSTSARARSAARGWRARREASGSMRCCIAGRGPADLVARPAAAAGGAARGGAASAVGARACCRTVEVCVRRLRARRPKQQKQRELTTNPCRTRACVYPRTLTAQLAKNNTPNSRRFAPAEKKIRNSAPA